MPWLIRTASCLLVALALLAGCGGGGRLSNAELAAKADGICAKYTARLKRLFRASAGSTPAQLVAAIDKALPVIRKGNKELAKLEPPTALADRYDRWIRRNRAEERVVKDMRDALAGSNLSDFSVALVELRRLEAKQDATARSLGLDGCARD